MLGGSAAWRSPLRGVVARRACVLWGRGCIACAWRVSIAFCEVQRAREPRVRNA